MSKELNPIVTLAVTSKHPIQLRLWKDLAFIGYMRITDKVELSIDEETWVDYDEGICEYGMALKWDRAVVYTG